MPDYVVQLGDCISSIAWQFGFDPPTIWNHPKNSDVRSSRKDPNVLLEGDVVYVPEKRTRAEGRATDASHKFVLKGVPALLKLQLLHNDKPRAHVRYILEIDGIRSEGNTDADGRLQKAISPAAQSGRLMLPETDDEYPLKLGHLDPIDTTTGQQQRLRNLGFHTGEINGETDQATRHSTAAFQQSKKLGATGELDQTTVAALKAAFGS